MVRLSSIAAVVILSTANAMFATAPLSGADPREVATGSFEILETEIRRVDSLLCISHDDSYPRYDAPEGMTFVVLRWTLKPTFEAADPFPMASIPDKEVFVEIDGVKSAPIGVCDPDGTFTPIGASLLAVVHENYPDAPLFTAVFLVPRSAKRATFLVAKLKVEEALEGEILPRPDWRDAMEIEVQKIAVLPEAKRTEETGDRFANLAYTIDFELQPRTQAMIAATVRIVPKRWITTENDSVFAVLATDLRLARDGQPALIPIGRMYESDAARLGQSILSAETAEDGTLLPIEATLIYGIDQPMEKATLLYRNAPLGEFDVEQAPPTAE